jgi:hypothetical protein
MSISEVAKKFWGNVSSTDDYVRAKYDTYRTKQRVRDVQALNKYLRNGRAKNLAATQPVLRAASRLGVNLDSYSYRKK